MKRLVAFLVGSALVAGACGGSGPGQLQFGVRRLALDIAFVDEDASPPVPPEIIVRLVPAPPEVLVPDFDFSTIEIDPELPELPPLPPLPPLPQLCPTAPPEATIGLIASPSILDPIAPGVYPRNNTGTITITAGGLPLQLPYPFISKWTVTESQEVERPGPLGTPSLGPAVQFSLEKSLGDGFEVTETYEISDEALLLIERVTSVNGVETRFKTDPPVEIFHFGAEGDDWSSAGVDTENDYAVLIQGVIADREVIDVCGELVDTFRIEYTEQVVNLADQETFGTKPEELSVINIAPQFGGLLVREELHTTQNTTTPDGDPVLVEFDYVSTIASMDPVEGF